MSQNGSSEIQEMRGSNVYEELSITSQKSQVVIVDVLPEEQPPPKPQENLIQAQTVMDLEHVPSNVAEASNNSSSMNISDVPSEIPTVQSTNNLSVLSHNSSHLQNNMSSVSSEAAASQNQSGTLPQNLIPFGTSESNTQFQHPGLSRSSVTPTYSSNDLPPTMRHVNMSASDIPSAAFPTGSMDPPQVVNVLPPQLLDPRIADASYGGNPLPLRYFPPPPYSEQPPFYDANGRTRSLATVSELQRAAPRPLAMPPPSYDATVEADRAYIVRDLHRGLPANARYQRNQGGDMRGRRVCTLCSMTAVVAMIVFLVLWMNA